MVKWVNIIVRLNVPLIVYVNEEEVEAIEPDPGEEEALISLLMKFARYGRRGSSIPPGWLSIPADMLTDQERTIAKYLIDLGIAKMEEGEVI